MLSSIRKFSNSIYAKILLAIIIIPFVFWGMGSSFTSGNKNVVVEIDKDKYSTQEFADFIQKFSDPNQKIDSDKIDELLSLFIGEKLIEKEINIFEIELSDKSLSKLIKNQKDFKKDNKFSRTEYEKFLIKNNMPAAAFESNLTNHEKKKQLLDFVGGGLLSPKFLVNKSFNHVNQKRIIQLINLNDLFNQKLNFSDNEILSYYKSNIDKYNEIYKSVKIIELNPKKLIGDDEYNDVFFKKIDEIDNIIISGENFDSIIADFNLEKSDIFTFDKLGKDKNSKTINNISENLAEYVFSLNDDEPTALLEIKDKYFMIEVVKTENIVKSVENATVKKTILYDLKIKIKRELISKIISKINQNNFTNVDFVQFSKDNNLSIKVIALKNRNDNKILKTKLVNEVYSYGKNKIILVHDIDFVENFLIYIEKIDYVKIGNEPDKYRKYSNLSNLKIASTLFDTYDNYVKRKYKIDINYGALEKVKNYFN